MVGVSTKVLFALILRLVLAWVFIRAGLPKVQDPIAFAASIDGYRIVSGSLTLWVATILPWLELVIGIGILTPWIRKASGTIMALLLCIFITLHISAWARGLDIACGCFDQEGSSTDYHLLIPRNLALLAAVFLALKEYKLKRSAPPTSIQ